MCVRLCVRLCGEERDVGGAEQVLLVIMDIYNTDLSRM